MDPNYRASEQQWTRVEDMGISHRLPGAECILELRARIEALEAAQQPQQDSPPLQKQTELELEESLAQIIYEQAIIPTARHCHAEAPEWVVGGNSIAQDDARATARAIIRRWPRGDQPQPQQDQSRDTPKMVDTGWRNLHDLSPIMEPAPPAPAGGLVKLVENALSSAQLDSLSWNPVARAAIREIAAATDQMAPDRNLTWERVALWLDQEANR